MRPHLVMARVSGERCRCRLENGARVYDLALRLRPAIRPRSVSPHRFDGSHDELLRRLRHLTLEAGD
jgi:hypothetical protein